MNNAVYKSLKKTIQKHKWTKQQATDMVWANLNAVQITEAQKDELIALIETEYPDAEETETTEA